MKSKIFSLAILVLCSGNNALFADQEVTNAQIAPVIVQNKEGLRAWVPCWNFGDVVRKNASEEEISAYVLAQKRDVERKAQESLGRLSQAMADCVKNGGGCQARKCFDADQEKLRRDVQRIQLAAHRLQEIASLKEQLQQNRATIEQGLRELQRQRENFAHFSQNLVDVAITEAAQKTVVANYEKEITTSQSTLMKLVLDQQRIAIATGNEDIKKASQQDQLRYIQAIYGAKKAQEMSVVVEEVQALVPATLQEELQTQPVAVTPEVLVTENAK